MLELLREMLELLREMLELLREMLELLREMLELLRETAGSRAAGKAAAPAEPRETVRISPGLFGFL
ncbi:hypothetical protein BO221_28755 [Archangium sp. Cb G35]|nr:hypothetical protein BO221_28755 [Archangium sp. Cb G35]